MGGRVCGGGLRVLLLVWASSLSMSASTDASDSTVRWVYMKDAEPIGWEEAGRARGIEVEIVNDVMRRLALTPEHRFYPWKRAQKLVAYGEADAMITTPTAARFRYAQFGKELVLPEYWNLFIPVSRPDMIEKAARFTRLEDMKPYALVDFLGNGWSEAFMRRSEGYDITEVSRIDQISTVLALGRFDMAINSSTWINWWAQKQGNRHKLVERYVDWPWTRFHFVFMVSRKSPWAERGLVRALDREIRVMKAEGAWKAVLKKYKNPHGEGAPFRSHLDAAYMKKHGFYDGYEAYPEYRPVEGRGYR